MTERLYYTDAYTTRFSATVQEQVRKGNHQVVILDRTFFYPTSGGQPNDLGHIHGLPVIDVTIRARDGAVEHHVLGELWNRQQITAEVNWPRRFDHMQQHTGQHILSQAFVRVAEAATVGFHLGEDYATIDLDTVDVMPAQVEEAETLANQVVWDDRPVKVRFVTPEEARELPLRKVPPLEHGRLRVVEIEDFDWNACGGTHVARTGEVGSIKITRLERRNQKLRLTFQCGERALVDYRHLNVIVSRLAADFTTGRDELVDSIERLRQESSSWRRQARRYQSELARLQGKLLHEEAALEASRRGVATVVTRVFEEASPEFLRELAAVIVDHPNTIVLLGLAGESSRLVFARSDDAPGDMSQALKAALQVLGTSAGGGQSNYAQGGGTAADRERVKNALARAERMIMAQSGGPVARG